MEEYIIVEQEDYRFAVQRLDSETGTYNTIVDVRNFETALESVKLLRTLNWID